jgi:hypothetical protein
VPPRRYEVAEWKLGVGVNIDYHITYDERHYSVPYGLIRASVDVRATASVIEIFHGGERVASHERSYGPIGKAETDPEHRPRSHREFGDWPPERLVRWAGKTGPSAAAVAEAILGRGPHPESGRRACLALVRMAERYGSDRVEASCKRALEIGNPTRKSVESILKSGLDKAAPRAAALQRHVVHENIRGGAYFDREKERRDAGETDEEIEARYLVEEREAIIMADRHEPLNEPPVKGSKTLPELLAVLQTSWSRVSPQAIAENDVSREERGEER